MGGEGIHLIKNSPYFGNIQVNKDAWELKFADLLILP